MYKRASRFNQSYANDLMVEKTHDIIEEETEGLPIEVLEAINRKKKGGISPHELPAEKSNLKNETKPPKRKTRKKMLKVKKAEPKKTPQLPQNYSEDSESFLNRFKEFN